MVLVVGGKKCGDGERIVKKNMKKKKKVCGSKTRQLAAVGKHFEQQLQRQQLHIDIHMPSPKIPLRNSLVLRVLAITGTATASGKAEKP